jgi:lipoprotein-releasing system ATP-binding protein
MKDIQTYFKFLIQKYNLSSEYQKFTTSLYTYVFTRETFFWIIILTQQSKLEDKNKMLKIIAVLFTLLILASLLENIHLRHKVILVNKLNESHLCYCFHLINNCDEKEVLSMNMVEQFMYIESIKSSGLDNVIQEKILIANCLVTTVTVILASRRINILLVSGLLVGFNSAIYFFQKKSMNKEFKLTEENNDNINNIRNYFIDSKQKIINRTFNTTYCLEMFNRYFQNNLELVKIENTLNTYNSVSVILITLIIVLIKYKTSTIFDIFVYLLIVYELDHFVDNLFNLYKIQKKFAKVNLHLSRLFKDKVEIHKKKSIIDNIFSIQIEKIILNTHQLKLKDVLNCSKGDHILCNGKSGEGKTTLFKILKDIEKPDELILFVNEKQLKDFGEIAEKVYLTVQNNKVMYDENLYSYISNHSSNPNINIIKELLKCVCIDHLFSGEEDKQIKVDQISGGEQMRLTLAQTLYNILEEDYQIILFDEIDVNLDNKTAEQIFENIFSYFKDKILFFIVHNEELKNKFHKQIFFQDHILYPNF